MVPTPEIVTRDGRARADVDGYDVIIRHRELDIAKSSSGSVAATTSDTWGGGGNLP
jgi:hypothetical protein